VIVQTAQSGLQLNLTLYSFIRFIISGTVKLYCQIKLISYTTQNDRSTWQICLVEVYRHSNWACDIYQTALTT
jgi:hypothetical protein